jgi:hypothetical protein
VDGFSLVGLMCIHGFKNTEDVILVLLIYVAILGFCYFQDHYMNPNKPFTPEKEPHTFAIPLHVLMILLIVGEATQHIDDDKSIKIAIITLISLGLTLVSYVLQRLQIKFQSKELLVYNLNDDDDEKGDDDDTQSEHGTSNDLEKVVPTQQTMDRLDAMLDEIRRGIQYESYYYINSTLFAMTVTWFIINITRSKETLKIKP